MGVSQHKLERITNKYVVKDDSCWVWVGSKLPAGYGQLGHRKKMLLAHRYFYEQHKGRIAKGMCVDHLCRLRCCVNPDHLEVVTQKENTLRGQGPAAINARKTHCKRGHSLSGDNLYTTPDSRRQCRFCRSGKAVL